MFRQQSAALRDLENKGLQVQQVGLGITLPVS
jgi:hypothetical protein